MYVYYYNFIKEHRVFRGIDEKKPNYDEEYGEPDEAFMFAEMDSDDLIGQVWT